MEDAEQAVVECSPGPPWEAIPLERYARQVPVLRRRIGLRAQDELMLPRFGGALWHSVLGPAIKELACTVPPGVCSGCPRRLTCEYPRLMEAESPESAGGPLGGGARVPGPLILDTGRWGSLRIDAGGRFHLDLALVGGDARLLETVEHAVAWAASRGLGRRRAVASVVGVEPRPALAEVLASLGSAVSSAVRLRLLSPLRLKRRGALLRRLDLRALARDLSWRLAALGHYHSGLPWPAPWSGALAEAARATVREEGIRWVDGIRYSARQGREIVTGGLVGEVLVEDAGADLVRLLASGSVIHAGKGASMGLGQLEVASVVSGSGSAG